MAYFSVSEYGKYISLQNVSGSGDPADAPSGGIQLFASGTAGSAKLYLRNEGGAPIDLTEAGILDLAGDTGTGEVDMAAAGSLSVLTGDGLSSVASGAAITISVDAGGITNDMLAGSIASSKIAELSNTFDTGDLPEGSNLYYTDARARAAVSVTDAGGDGSLAYDSSTGVITYTGPSAAEARAHFSADGDLVSYDSSTGAFSTVAANFTASWDVKMGLASTADLAEDSGSRYFTEARARASVSATDAGGDGSFAYDSSTGVFTYTGPSAAEARAHFSGGTGVDITDGVVSIGQAVATSSDVQFNDIQADGNVVISGNLTINGSQNVIEADTVQFKDTLLDMGLEDDGSGGLQAPSSESSKDQGLVFNRKVGSNNRKTAFFWDESADKFRMADQVSETAGVLSAGNLATLQANLEGDVTGDLTGNVTGNVTGDLTGDVTGQVSDISNHNTGDLAEGSNLYFTDARARAAVSVTDAGGDGSLAYDSSTGVITYTGPSASEVRAHLSVTDNGGDGSLSYDNSTGVISYTGPSAAEVRAHFSAGTGVAIADGQISVGQAIGTSDSPEFASLQVSDLTQGRIVLAGASGELEDSASLRFAGGLLDVTASAGISLNGSVNFANGYLSNSDYGMSFDSTSGQLVARGAGSFDGGVNALGGYGGGSGVSISSGGIQSRVNLIVGANGAGKEIKFFGDSADAFLLWDADKLAYSTDAGSSNDIEIGLSQNGFAIEVAQLAGDAGKIKATAFVTYSDESLKSDVVAMDTALDTVMSLKGVEFTWKNSGERDFGFIAQEVAQVVPQAVSTGADGISGVDYSRLTSVLVEAVKAQQVQIEDLKKALLNK